MKVSLEEEKEYRAQKNCDIYCKLSEILQNSHRLEVLLLMNNTALAYFKGSCTM